MLSMPVERSVPRHLYPEVRGKGYTHLDQNPDQPFKYISVRNHL